MRAALLVLCLIARPAGAEAFFDIGVGSSRIESRNTDVSARPDRTETGLHLGVGASRRVGERGELSVRLELDDLGSDLLLAVRALDYRRHISERLAFNVFIGAARLDLETPAFGYYYGAGLQFKEIVSNWDLSIDLRIADEVARDNLLPSDPQGGNPDNFRDIFGVSVYLTRRF
ncbi:MAG: hypothetical protein V3S94_02165 [Gammaproteobacteria bacterium]